MSVAATPTQRWTALHTRKRSHTSRRQLRREHPCWEHEAIDTVSESGSVRLVYVSLGGEVR